MDISKLQRPLTASEIEFRVGTVIKSGEKVYSTLLAYKDARTDMKVLDGAVGASNWQNILRKEGESFISGIGIKIGDEWVWKEYNGTATDYESEKGGASDAFKRAGFMWGIGRGLYDFPKIFITLTGEEYEIKKNQSGKDIAVGTSKLRPQDWTWEVKYNEKNELILLRATQNVKNPLKTVERFKYEVKVK